MNLIESIFARKRDKTNAFSAFTDDLKQKIQTNKEELDATIQTVKLASGSELLNKSQEDEVIEDLETTVSDQVEQIAAGEREEKLKESYMLNKKAAQYIVNMKDKLREAEEMNQTLIDQMQRDQTTIMSAVHEHEDDKLKAQEVYNTTVSNKMKLIQLTAMNPPPLFDTCTGFGKASGLLAFFNEDLEDYFVDICVEDNIEKSRLLLKVFGDKSVEYKRTTKRFFKQVEVNNLLNDPSTKMRVVYKELVHYMFVEKPKGDVGTRKDSESLTNFLERWFTLKDYCGVSETKQGASVIAKIFKTPSVLNCSADVIREFKKEFFVKHANDQPIDKASVLGFAERIDMLFAGANELGIHALTASQSVSTPVNNTVDTSKLEFDNINAKLAELMNSVNNQASISAVNQNPYVSDKGNFQNNKAGGFNKPSGYNNKGPGGNFRGSYNFTNKGNGYGNGNPQNRQNAQAVKAQRRCFICNELGHYQYECPSKNSEGYNNRNKNFNRFENMPSQQATNGNNGKIGNIENWQSLQAQNKFKVDLASFCVMANGGDMREYIDTSVVPGAAEKSLLDTGASLDAICPKLLAEYGISNKIDASKAAVIELADGTKVKTDGVINVTVDVSGKEFEVEFRVMPNLRPKIIYGAPFLEKAGILRQFREAIRTNLGQSSQESKN